MTEPVIDPTPFDEFVEDVRRGFLDEQQMVRFIQTYLLTDYQTQWLTRHQLTIADLLNGRYPARLVGEIEPIYEFWNVLLDEPQPPIFFLAPTTPRRDDFEGE